MGELSVSRWQKYGKDRLYVTAADGRKVGWHDLVSGETHAEQLETLLALESSVRSWLSVHPEVKAHSRRPAVAPMPTVAPPTPPSGPPLPAGVLPPVVVPDPRRRPLQPDDLSHRQAGEAVRQQALALRRAAPVRTFVERVFDAKTDERAWRIGADGEEMVADQLAKLCKKDPRWLVLHSVPVGERGSDIDHVVIGPAGVFTLNTKHHPDAKVWVKGDRLGVNGRGTFYVRNSRHEAARAGRFLAAALQEDVTATGLIVVVGATSLDIRQQPEDVRVVPRPGLVEWLRRRPETLSGPKVARIHAVAARPETWRRTTSSGNTGADGAARVSGSSRTAAVRRSPRS